MKDMKKPLNRFAAIAIVEAHIDEMAKHLVAAKDMLKALVDQENKDLDECGDGTLPNDKLYRCGSCAVIRKSPLKLTDHEIDCDVVIDRVGKISDDAKGVCPTEDQATSI